jgi:CRP/FNR family cyclic AMP-dependent transcriptional regulator
MISSDGSLDLFNEVDGVEVIQKTQIFAKLGFDETVRLAGIIHIEKFPRGQLILEQDSLAQALYIIRTGEVAVRRHDSKGQRDVIGTFGPGEIFGEMSLIDDTLVSADVEVTSDEVEVVVIPRESLDVLLKSDDRFAVKVYRSFCRTLSDRLRKTTHRFAELHDEPASR